jgi:nitroimidazol reductase NimA-like FMN-containing flavoprotein (pyridoxamine 5'-phosphate oxidase superfamily)
VIVNGHYQELPEPQYADERAHARKLLEKRYLWWQNALGERQVKSGEELITPTFFRIRIGSMTGLRAIAEGR